MLYFQRERCLKQHGWHAVELSRLLQSYALYPSDALLFYLFRIPQLLVQGRVFKHFQSVQREMHFINLKLLRPPESGLPLCQFTGLQQSLHSANADAVIGRLKSIQYRFLKYKHRKKPETTTTTSRQEIFAIHPRQPNFLIYCTRVGLPYLQIFRNPAMHTCYGI
jgi:hypothetical protein